MATKKTPAPVKKAVPVKKPATAIKQAPKPRTDYKPGTRVKVKRRSGDEVKGFVTHVETKLTGAFVHVNIGTKQVPIMLAARPVTVRGF
jgi:primosomal protein N'